MNKLIILIATTFIFSLQAQAAIKLDEKCKSQLLSIVTGLAAAEGYSPELAKITGAKLEIFDDVRSNSDGSITYFGRYIYGDGYYNYTDYAMTGNRDCAIESIIIQRL